MHSYEFLDKISGKMCAFSGGLKSRLVLRWSDENGVSAACNQPWVVIKVIALSVKSANGATQTNISRVTVHYLVKYISHFYLQHRGLLIIQKIHFNNFNNPNSMILKPIKVLWKEITLTVIYDIFQNIKP